MKNRVGGTTGHPFYKMAIVATALMLTMSPMAIAQDERDSDLGVSSNANEVRPSLQSSADLLLPDGRNISIHREAQIKERRSRPIYFHRPLFAFKNNPGPDTDHPAIWDKIEYEGAVYISMTLMLSSPKFRELARGAVIEEDPSIHVEMPEIQERSIDVRPWPLKLLRLEAKHSLIGLELGESIPKSLSTSGDEIEVSLKIDANDYSQFLQALASGRIEFSPSYTFTNAIVAFGQAATNISGEVSVAIDNALASRQLEEGGPIFQEDARELRNTLRQTITTTIRGTDASVLAHITPQDISNQILKPEPLTFESLIGNQDLLKKVDAYLAPIIREMQRSNEETEQESQTDTTTKRRSIKAGYGSAGFTGDVSLSEEQVKELQNKHGVVFKETEDRDVIEPHSIEVNYVRQGWQDSIVDIFQTVYLAVGRDNSFQTDSPVRVDFTLERLNEAIGANEVIVSRYSGVPKGVPMLSFRADIPKGWVALDGTTNWPEESWVPEHLRGQPVPDMSGAFARGASGEEQIGLVQREATISIPETEISGAGFTMEPGGSGGVLDRTGKIELFSYRVDTDDSNNNHWHRPTRERFLTARITAGIGSEYRAGSGRNAKVYPEHSSLPELHSQNAKLFSGNLLGSSKIPAQDIDLSQSKNQPPHAVGQWIMRVE